MTLPLPLADAISSIKVDAQTEGSVGKYFYKRLVRYGVILVIGGIGLGIFSFHAEQIGLRGRALGEHSLAQVTGAFKNVAPPAAFQPLNPLSWAGTVSSDAGSVATALGDLPNALSLTFTAGIRGVFEVSLGELSFAVGWLGEQVFPWMMLVGIIMIGVGAAVGLIDFYYREWDAYMRPRTIVRNKAFKRRWLQQPLDRFVIPTSTLVRAEEWNRKEAAVNAIAYNEFADPQAVELAVKDNLPTKTSDKLKADDEAVVARVLDVGVKFGPEQWTKQFVSGHGRVVLADSKIQQDVLLLTLSHRREVRAVARITDINGRPGAAFVGLSAGQALYLADLVNSEDVFVGRDLLLVTPVEKGDTRGNVRKEFDIVEIGKTEPTEAYWVHFDDERIALYVSWHTKKTKAGEAPPPPPPPPPTAPAPSTPAPPDVSNSEPEPLHELTLEEWEALTQEQQAELLKTNPQAVPKEYYNRSSQDITL